MIVLAGSSVENPRHLLTREGAGIGEIIGKPKDKSPIRYIIGGVLTGRKSNSEGAIGYVDYAIHALPDGKPIEPFAFFKPGYKND